MLIKKGLQLLAVGALVLWLTLGQSIPAAKANGPSITIEIIEPTDSRVSLGDQVTVEVVVWEAMYVNAYKLTINYDPQRMSLSSWSHGVFLQNVHVNTESNQSGVFYLDVTQLGSPPVSGNGALLELVFNTLSAGSATINIHEATLFEPNGATHTPALIPGTVEISANPASTAQPNPTLNAAPTATNQPPNPTQTGIPNSSATPFPSETAAATELASSALQGQAGGAAFLPYIVNGVYIEELLTDASLYLPMVLQDYTPALLVDQTTQSAPPDYAEATPVYTPSIPAPKQPGSSNRMETVLWAILILGAAGLLWMVKTLRVKPTKS
jgi:hypothetical protein